MKKLIISIYVAVVVAISLLAQASFASGLVELHGAYVVLSKDASKILVAGRYPNPCVSNVQIDIVPALTGELVLQVNAEKSNDACIAVLGEAFKTVLPVESLKEKLANLSVDPNGTYNVVTADGSFNEVIDFAKTVSSEPTGEFTTMIKVNIAKRPEVHNF